MLDLNRLRSQRREARDILRLCRGELHHFDAYHQATDVLHPAVAMWRGHVAALARYYNACLAEYARRGHSNGSFERAEEGDDVVMPAWFGDEAFHRSHRQKLLAKLPAHYSRLDWEPATQLDETKLQYVWPAGGWAEYQAARRRLKEESPPDEATRERISEAYRAWKRCTTCGSHSHRAHLCPHAACEDLSQLETPTTDSVLADDTEGTSVGTPITSQCAAVGCVAAAAGELRRIGYCGGHGVGQGARIVAVCKKGRVASECTLQARRASGKFLRGDSLCVAHVAQLKQVFMLTAHPLAKHSAGGGGAGEEDDVGSARAASGDVAPSTRYCIGHAVSSRAKCADCRKLIAEGELRFGVERRFGAPPEHHYEAKWRHLECCKPKLLQHALVAAGGVWNGLRGWEQLETGEQNFVTATFELQSPLSGASGQARKRHRPA